MVRRNERGYVLVLLSVSMTAMVIMAAIVVDLSFLRDDRRTDQKVADSAGADAAVMLATTTRGQDACRAAFENVKLNVPEIDTITGQDCSTFANSCDVTTASKTTTGVSGPYTVTVVYPVEDDHPYMTDGSAIGSATRSATAGDGDPCNRVGIGIMLSRDASFAGVIDNSAKSTSVHTVALASTRLEGPLPINLLILERTGCDAVKVDGTGATLIIDPIVRGTEIFPGVLAVESDGTGPSCGSGIGTLNVQSGLLRSDGPACPTQQTTGVGHGCGDITLYAPGVPGSATPGRCQNGHYQPACTANSSGRIYPNPARMGKRYTRGAVDHMFNCKASYTSEPWYAEHPVNPCFSGVANTDLDYVDELFAFAEGVTQTSTSGFNVYGDDTVNEPCSVDGSPSSFINVPQGNTLVICPLLKISRTMTFGGGNIIFAGDVQLDANGTLNIHQCAQDDTCTISNPLTWASGGNFDEKEYSNDSAWTVFKNGGSFTKSGGGVLNIYDSTVFLPRDADVGGKNVAFAGGSGALRWNAARTGPFEHMALWSEGFNEHAFAGQATLALEGVFFSPVGLVTYFGTGSQQQVAAQFITETMRVSGSGGLQIAPNTDRSILHNEARSTIIR